MVGLPADTNNPLLVSAGLSRPIPKIILIFCICQLSGPTFLHIEHKILVKIFLYTLDVHWIGE
jgi:hypothetical protein